MVYAPWRSAYVKTVDERRGCFFCQYASEGSEILVYRGRFTLVTLNLFPYTWGHLLIAPLRHVATVSDLSFEEFVEMVRLVDASIRVLRRVLGPDDFAVGINVGRAAGAGVEEHIHIHVIPRYRWDTRPVEDFDDIYPYMVRLAEVLRREFEAELGRVG